MDDVQGAFEGAAKAIGDATQQAQQDCEAIAGHTAEAAGGAAKALDEAGQQAGQDCGAAAEAAGQALGDAGQQAQQDCDAAIKDAEAKAKEVAEHTRQFLEKAAGGVAEQASGAFDEMKNAVGNLVEGLQDFQWDQIPAAIIDYIKENPKTTTLQLVCLLVAVSPSLVATPTLFALGFGIEGPITGWLAASFQSAFGTPLAFSTLQRAAMGGWGVGAVDGIVQASAASVAGVAEVSEWQDKDGGEDEAEGQSA
ncbi:hypothetical protein M409DRAFT_26553 [Zasmidium cellare ATCC 36951]|uniref:Uncharacterized protein n=1 Tax=Zasmidium cellare ATCC 36951 TaxID=1080233 RepID=A0A6A6C7E5_ZASCE|nr:uncharacterized protein M409DRAFT_26553 [Zasmidium cellare ATCC 36951]KAF2163107.1 hypothetical protein M409DRAFT_26553 [Zasmidium cellare ATCC 36951]